MHHLTQAASGTQARSAQTGVDCHQGWAPTGVAKRLGSTAGTSRHRAEGARRDGVSAVGVAPHGRAHRPFRIRSWQVRWVEGGSSGLRAC